MISQFLKIQKKKQFLYFACIIDLIISLLKSQGVDLISKHQKN
jgi:hypothetical protein